MIIVEWFHLSLLLSIVFTRLLFVERVVLYNQILVIIIVLLCHSGSLGVIFSFGFEVVHLNFSLLYFIYNTHFSYTQTQLIIC